MDKMKVAKVGILLLLFPLEDYFSLMMGFLDILKILGRGSSVVLIPLSTLNRDPTTAVIILGKPLCYESFSNPQSQY